MLLHRFSHPVFRRYGGVYQLCLERPEDLDHLHELEEGRWMATSCPRFGLRVDPGFLALLDADGNGRVISDELCDAVRWLRARLRADPSWTEQRDSLPLSLIDQDRPEGASLLEAANSVLATQGTPDSAEITVAQIRQARQAAAQMPRNGDGVVPPAVISDAELAELARVAAAALGGVQDASGGEGVDNALLDRFEREAAAYLDWWETGQAELDTGCTEIMPWGTATSGMYAVLQRLQPRIELYFLQCALIRQWGDEAVVTSLRTEVLRDLDREDAAAIRLALERVPLAVPTAAGVLPLRGSQVNEAHAGDLEELLVRVVRPVLGPGVEKLDAAAWKELTGRFAAHAAWVRRRPDTPVAGLGVERLRWAMAGGRLEQLRALTRDDLAAAPLVQQLQDLEKLALFHQWLFAFANNYVSFPHLFDRDRALFETGSLVLEGREYNFSVQVDNRARHAALACNSGMFLLYLAVTSADPKEAFEVAVPVTRGSTDGLYVGRRGVFFTVDGHELDAQIVQIVPNPVSFWSEMMAPLRFIRDLVARRFEQMSTSLQKEAELAVGRAGTQVESSLQTGIRQAPQAAAGREAEWPAAGTGSTPAQVPPARSASNARDLMVGVGLLAAGLGTGLKFLTDTARQLTSPQTMRVVVVILAALAAVMALMTAFTAWRKLRRRDLGGLLQASGWSINSPLRLTRLMARLFTRRTRLPRGARRRGWHARLGVQRPVRASVSPGPAGPAPPGS